MYIPTDEDASEEIIHLKIWVITAYKKYNFCMSQLSLLLIGH